MLSGKTIAFIGSGVMAEAIIKGLLREKMISPEQLVAAGPRPERGQLLSERYNVQYTTDNRSAVIDREIVVLSIKPQMIRQVMLDIRGKLKSNALLLSIVAGVPIALLNKGIQHDAIVRAMPNTPAQIGEGITVWMATASVTIDQLSETDMLLSALGESLRVEEETFLDMATALSGTGPAYVLLFMEAMIDAGVHMGFSRRIAEKLVLQTMRGTIDYARQSPRHPATLRNEVTSPGGTSAEALYQLEKGGLRTVVSRAIWAAYQRSVSLGQGQLARHVVDETLISSDD